MGNALNVPAVKVELGTGVDKTEGIDLFATVGMSPEWEIPFGVNFSAIAGLITQRYMHETGTTPEQVASVCVSLRKWAQLNPHAMYRGELTVQDVLDSKMLATPVHAFESNMLADGGGAYVVTSPERARELSDTPVYLLGASGRTTHYTLAAEADMGRFKYADAAKDAFAMAGLTPQDMQLAQIYDSYPVFVLMALAARRTFPLWVRALLAYSNAAWLYGIWYWMTFVRA